MSEERDGIVLTDPEEVHKGIKVQTREETVTLVMCVVVVVLEVSAVKVCELSRRPAGGSTWL